MCHKCLLSVEILGEYTHASPTFPPPISSSLIHITLFSYSKPVVVTSLTYLLARKIPTPPFLAALGLSQLRSPDAASRIQLAYASISLEPRFSNALLLIITMSIFGVREFRNHFSFAMFSGSLRPRILWVTIFHFIRLEKRVNHKYLPGI
jgi:hypothetical protein